MELSALNIVRDFVYYHSISLASPKRSIPTNNLLFHTSSPPIYVRKFRHYSKYKKFI